MAFDTRPQQQFRRIGTAGLPTNALAGQLIYQRTAAAAVGGAAGVTNPGPDNLYVGDGTGIHALVSNARQVELWGDQTINGEKTFNDVVINDLTIDVSDFNLGGGTNGAVLTTDGAGGLSWVTAPPATVVTALPITGTGAAATPIGLSLVLNASLTGTGITATPLAVVPATGAEITAGTNNTQAITPLGLATHLSALNFLSSVSVTAPITGNGTSGTPLAVTMATAGDLTTGTSTTSLVNPAILATLTGSPTALATTATTIIPAINELRGQVLALQQHIRFVGTVNGTSGVIVAAAGGPATSGPLPAAAPANEGWLLISTVAGPGGNANLPAGPIAVGDMIVSDG